MKQVLYNAILRVVGDDAGFQVEHPSDEHHGDFATNAAMILAKREGINPREVAERLCEKLGRDRELGGIVEKIEMAGPGFINFYLKPETLIQEAAEAVKVGEAYGTSEWGKGKRMLIDYSSPNIAKRFSVGHLRSTIIGQALYNLYGASGWEVVGDNHLGDWGTQFGMIIAAVEEQGLDVTAMSVDDLECIYVEYNRQVEEKPDLKDRARDAFARLEHGEAKAREIWQQAVKVSMDEFERIYAQLGVKIDYAYGESAYESLMPAVIVEAKEKGIASESEGALIVEFPDMPPAMLVKSNGTTTYFTRDLATIKFRQFQPHLKSDLYIYEVGAEQKLHFSQVFRTAELLGWGKEEDFTHVAHGRLRLPEGKMSTRKGNTVKLEDLIEEAKRRAALLGKEGQGSEGTQDEVGIGAIKFNELKRHPQADYVFRWDEALNMEGDSGPYLQYTYARARSVLAKANYQLTDINFQNLGELENEELQTLRWLYRYPEVVEEAARQFAPHQVATFIIELSRRYNSLYNNLPILTAESEGKRNLRLLLTAAVAQITKNGLNILGIAAPEKM